MGSLRLAIPVDIPRSDEAADASCPKPRIESCRDGSPSTNLVSALVGAEDKPRTDQQHRKRHRKTQLLRDAGNEHRPCASGCGNSAGVRVIDDRSHGEAKRTTARRDDPMSLSGHPAESGTSRVLSHAGVNPPTSNPAGLGARSAEGHVRATTISNTNRRNAFQSRGESGASETRPPSPGDASSTDPAASWGSTDEFCDEIRKPPCSRKGRKRTNPVRILGMGAMNWALSTQHNSTSPSGINW